MSHFEIVHCMQMHNNASDMHVSACSYECPTLVFVRIGNDFQMYFASVMYDIALLITSMCWMDFIASLIVVIRCGRKMCFL